MCKVSLIVSVGGDKVNLWQELILVTQGKISVLADKFPVGYFCISVGLDEVLGRVVDAAYKIKSHRPMNSECLFVR
jgi:hypothetical protein